MFLFLLNVAQSKEGIIYTQENVQCKSVGKTADYANKADPSKWLPIDLTSLLK